jgi:hypothetical protein
VGCVNAPWDQTEKITHGAEGSSGAHAFGYNHPIRQAVVVQRADMKRVSFKGVAIGNVVDIVASNIVMVPVMIYVLASAKTGSPPDHDAASVTEALKTSNVFLATSKILGGLCSVLGGYVSARIRRTWRLPSVPYRLIKPGAEAKWRPSRPVSDPRDWFRLME